MVVSADGKPLGDKDALNKIIETHQIGDTLTLQARRGEQTVQVPITLRERPAQLGIPPPGTGP